MNSTERTIERSTERTTTSKQKAQEDTHQPSKDKVKNMHIETGSTEFKLQFTPN